MLWWLIETTVVAGLLAMVAGVLARLQPPGVGPATRHALWLVVLVKLVTPPLVQSPWAVAVPAVADAAAPGYPEPEARFGPIPEAVTVALAPLDVAAQSSNLEARFARRLRLTRRNEANADRHIVVSQVLAPETRVVAGRALPAAPAPTLAGRPAVKAAWPNLAWPLRERAGRVVLGLWLAAALGMAGVQGLRIARFARRIRGGERPPGWLAEAIDDLAGRLGVKAPRALVVSGIGVPMLWCLGRPTLLLPAHLVETLGVGRWRGVIAHELAHLRRGDPWVGRLALLAGIVWWWNPLYHLARRRVEAEAELACDAWVVSVLPGDRVVYAGTMLEICESLLSCRKVAPPLAPALGGGTGAGRFFERRLTMILNDRVPCRLTWPGLIAPGLLVLAGLPTWTASGALVVDDLPREGARAARTEPRIVVAPVAADEGKAKAETKVVVGHAIAVGESPRTIVLTPGGTANVDGKVFLVTPDGQPQVDGKTITGRLVVDGKTIVVRPVDGAADTPAGAAKMFVITRVGTAEGEARTVSRTMVVDGKTVVVRSLGGEGTNEPIRVVVAGDDGKPVEVRGIKTDELKAKAEEARAEALKHVEEVRARAKARVEAARAQVDRAAEAVKRAKAEAKEAEGAKDDKAADAAEKALDKANASLRAAMAQLKAAEAAAQAAGRARVEVRTEVRRAGEAAAHATAKADGDKEKGARGEVRRRIEIRKHIGPDGKEQVEVRELPAEGEKADARGDGDRTRRDIEVRVVPRDGDKPKGKAKAKAKGDDDDDDDDRPVEIRVRDLTKLFGPDSEFMKGLENLGPELEKSLREALGPGTEFDAKMKDLGSKLGKELKENLGPGSAFDKAMKELSKALESQFGPGSEFEKQMQEFAREFEARVRPGDKDKKAETPQTGERPARGRERPAPGALRERVRERVQERQRERDREIQSLEARIKELQEQLEKVRKAEKDKD